ncbi:hypothetical protein GCM10018966_007750 [Streptomyces yanii]
MGSEGLSAIAHAAFTVGCFGLALAGVVVRGTVIARASAATAVAAPAHRIGSFCARLMDLDTAGDL